MADEDPDDTGTDDTIDVGKTDPPPWVPPTMDEHTKMQRALAKANTEAKANREALRALQAKSESADGKAAREAAEAAEKRYKPVAVAAAARAEFLQAGLQTATTERLTRMVRMLDLDSLDIDDAGEVTGLAEQVGAIKKEYPELFGTAEKKPPRITGSDRQATGGQPKRSADLLAAQVLGG